MAEQIRWQIEHPEGSKEAVLEHLRAFVKEGGGNGGGAGGGEEEEKAAAGSG